MSPWVLIFTDGTTFFIGLLLTAAASLLFLACKRRWARSALTVATLAGALLVVSSSTPIPLWLYALWLCACPATLALELRAASSLRARRAAAAGAVLASLLLAAIEAPWHFPGHASVPRGSAVYVLGDSISAGTGKDKTWPAMFAEKTGLHTTNLARAGATVEGAITQSKNVPAGDSLVIIEIGGNDILGKTTPQEFAARLDQLASSLKAQGHQVVLLETPLFPFKNAFGQAQRSTAAKHALVWVPKRVFASVLGTPDGTVDGLHLSAIGHDKMAQALAQAVQTR